MAHQWFIKSGGNQRGPFSSSQLKQLAEQGHITPDTSVRRGETGNWVPAWNIKGLFPKPKLASAPPVDFDAGADDFSTARESKAVSKSEFQLFFGFLTFWPTLWVLLPLFIWAYREINEDLDVSQQKLLLQQDIRIEKVEPASPAAPPLSPGEIRVDERELLRQDIKSMQWARKIMLIVFPLLPPFIFAFGWLMGGIGYIKKNHNVQKMFGKFPPDSLNWRAVFIFPFVLVLVLLRYFIPFVMFLLVAVPLTVIIPAILNGEAAAEEILRLLAIIIGLGIVLFIAYIGSIKLLKQLDAWCPIGYGGSRGSPGGRK